jgi:homospermidine synthase
VDDLMRLVRENHITEVVDLSSIDTRDCASACDAERTHFLCTSVEEWPGQVSIPTDAAISRLLPPLRPHLENASHLVGTGANPGIVNALVFAALQAFADRIGVGASAAELDLYAALITEEDTTADSSQSESTDVFAMTWSPQHCLEELCEPRAFAARAGRIEDLGHRPTERWYRARCGESVIEGMAVPHEEIVTLARRFPTLEIAFLYRIPLAARRALATHSSRNPGAWSTRRLYPPFTGSIAGEDRVGVLLCSRRFGELWMGFRTDVAAGLALGTNATQLQVAAGVLAGWSQIGTRSGILFVEDLDWHAYLDTAIEVLGAPIVVHDAGAPPMLLEDRLSATPAEAASLGA